MKFIILGEKQDHFGHFENDAIPSHDGRRVNGRRHNGRKAQLEEGIMGEGTMGVGTMGSYARSRS